MLLAIMACRTQLQAKTLIQEPAWPSDILHVDQEKCMFCILCWSPKGSLVSSCQPPGREAFPGESIWPVQHLKYSLGQGQLGLRHLAKSCRLPWLKSFKPMAHLAVGTAWLGGASMHWPSIFRRMAPMASKNKKPNCSLDWRWGQDAIVENAF